MAAPTNGSGNLVEEFEESFQACLNVLTKQEASACVEKEEVKVEVERFIDVARQMEAFFLQKRFLLSALRPELLVKEDNNELRLELARKEELLRRHYDRIAVWQNLLAEMQVSSKQVGDVISSESIGYAKSPAQNAGAGTASAASTPPAATPPALPQPSTAHLQQNSLQAQQMAAAAALQQQQQQQQHLQVAHRHAPPVPPPAYPSQLNMRRQ